MIIDQKIGKKMEGESFGSNFTNLEKYVKALSNSLLYRPEDACLSGETLPRIKNLKENDGVFELCSAATKIQASFRGHQARQQAGQVAEKKVDELSKDIEKMAPTADGEELDIDLSDPDLHKAATKIQASFRGHKVRKDDK